MKIRTAAIIDLDLVCAFADEIAELHNDKEPQIFLTPDLERDRTFWRACIEQVDGTILVAAEGETALGFVAAKISPASAPSFLRRRTICRIGTIVVSRCARREGIGSALIRAIEIWAIEQSAIEVRLEVFSFNEQAVAFYERLGYGVQSRNMYKGLVGRGADA